VIPIIRRNGTWSAGITRADRMKMSLAVTALAWMRTRTSSGLGNGFATFASCKTSGGPYLRHTTAFIVAAAGILSLLILHLTSCVLALTSRWKPTQPIMTPPYRLDPVHEQGHASCEPGSVVRSNAQRLQPGHSGVLRSSNMVTDHHETANERVLGSVPQAPHYQSAARTKVLPAVMQAPHDHSAGSTEIARPGPISSLRRTRPPLESAQRVGNRLGHGQRANSTSRASTIWKRRLGSSPMGRTVRVRSDPSTSAVVIVKATCE